MSHPHRTSRLALAATVVASLAPAAALAQHAASGITAASFAWEDGRREHAAAAVLQLAPAPWLLVGAVPTVLAVEVPGAERRIGFADLPAFVGLTHASALPLRPTIGVAGTAAFATGDAEQGLGRGRSSYGVEGSMALSPLPFLTVRAGAARLLRDGDTAPRGVATTSVFGDGVLSLGWRTNASVGYAAEQRGEAPAEYVPQRAISAAIVHATKGGTALMLGAARTLEGAGPRWSVALGIGTAFAGVAPVGAGSVAGRGTGVVRRPAAGAPALPLPGTGTGCSLPLGC